MVTGVKDIVMHALVDVIVSAFHGKFFSQIRQQLHFTYKSVSLSSLPCAFRR